MELARFFIFVIQLTFALALLGELKSCTVQMMSKAAIQTERGMISYSKFTHLLTR